MIIIKKYFFIIISFILFIVLLIFSKDTDVEYKEFYSEVIGFSKNDEKAKPVQQDKVLLMNNDDFVKFKDEYFTPREIPIESPDKEKAVLYLQIPTLTSWVNTYNVQSITSKGNSLTVILKKSRSGHVDSKSGFNGTWKWVMFIEVDKTNLKDNMKIFILK